MGRVGTSNEQSKMFEGNPTSIPDSRSIQAAIKGHLTDESQANSKNMTTLNGLANVDLFYPKRTTLPNSTAAYYRYPTPNISFEVLTPQSYYDETETVIYFKAELNYFVGYDIDYDITIFLGTDLQNGHQASLTIAAKSKSNVYFYTTNGSSNPTLDVTIQVAGIPFLYVEGSNNLNISAQEAITLTKQVTTNQNGRLYGRYTNFEPTNVTLSTDGVFSITNNTETFLTQSSVTSQTLTVALNGNTATIYRRAALSTGSWSFWTTYSAPFTADFSTYDYYVVMS